MTACIILLNIIIEDEKDEAELDVELTLHSDLVQITNAPSERFNKFVRRHVKVVDSSVNAALVGDLRENIWKMHGNGTLPRLQPGPSSIVNH